MTKLLLKYVPSKVRFIPKTWQGVCSEECVNKIYLLRVTLHFRGLISADENVMKRKVSLILFHSRTEYQWGYLLRYAWKLLFYANWWISKCEWSLFSTRWNKISSFTKIVFETPWTKSFPTGGSVQDLYYSLQEARILLTPCDFFLSGHLKNIVYSENNSKFGSF